MLLRTTAAGMGSPLQAVISGRPGSRNALVSQNAKHRVDHDHRQYGDRPTARGTFAPIAEEWDKEQGNNQDDRKDQDDEGFSPRRAE